MDWVQFKKFNRPPVLRSFMRTVILISRAHPSLIILDVRSQTLSSAEIKQFPVKCGFSGRIEEGVNKRQNNK